MVPPLAIPNVPPNVSVPVAVIGPPVKVSPVVLVALTLVTVPLPLLLNVVQSDDVNRPVAEEVALGILKVLIIWEPLFVEEMLKFEPLEPVVKIWVSQAVEVP